MVLKNISPGCGVRASLMLFFFFFFFFGKFPLQRGFVIGSIFGLCTQIINYTLVWYHILTQGDVCLSFGSPQNLSGLEIQYFLFCLTVSAGEGLSLLRP